MYVYIESYFLRLLYPIWDKNQDSAAPHRSVTPSYAVQDCLDKRHGKYRTADRDNTFHRSKNMYRTDPRRFAVMVTSSWLLLLIK